MRQIKLLVWLLVGGVVSSTEQLQFLKNFLEAVHKERYISTILLMQRKVHKHYFLHGLYPISWPIIRFDETKRVELVNNFNKDILALDFNHIRDARIMIWLQMSPSETFLQNIVFQASEQKFLNLVVIENTLKTRRFYPFPQPMVQVIDKPFEEKEIYPALWRNFMGKNAIAVPDLVPPRSFYSFNPKTGHRTQSGSVYKVFKAFTQRYNITMLLKWPLNTNTTQKEIIERTVRGEIDLPLTGQLISFRHPNGSRAQPLLGMTALSIAVPCGPELPMFDRFFLVYGLTTSC
ncbi:GM19468 [Drosophila sechellia]|uniref:GM19468 n=1 Tax=Drosophila sechellia TaxID=7238 RepID=B4HMN8_DROSE|nr:GM19468 [Drosophila sechellia]